MKKTASVLARLLLFLFIGSGAINLKAQVLNDSITVRVPFAFTAGTQTIGPGNYKFSLVSGEFLLSMVDVRTGHSQMLNVKPRRQSSWEERGQIVFRSLESRRVLSEVHFPNTDTFVELDRPLRAWNSHTGRSAPAMAEAANH